MTKVTKLIIFAAVFALVAVLGSLSVNYLYAAWQGPTAEPADPNVAAPIHSGGPQTKTGALTLQSGVISNLLRSIGYGDSNLSFNNNAKLNAHDNIYLDAEDEIQLKAGSNSSRIQIDPDYNGVRVDDNLCLNSWNNCISDWTEIAGIQSCEDLSCGVERCSDCSYDNKYVNLSGDSMTGQLMVNNKIVSNSANINGNLDVTGEIVSHSNIRAENLFNNGSVSGLSLYAGDGGISTTGSILENDRPVRTEFRIVSNSESGGESSVICAENEKVMGGGCICGSAASGGCQEVGGTFTCVVSQNHMTISRPFDVSGISGWYCQCREDGGIEAYAICAR